MANAEVWALIGIVIAHLAVAILLFMAVQRSGVLSNNTPPLTTTLLTSTSDKVSVGSRFKEFASVDRVEVKPPSFDIDTSHDDPLASAAQATTPPSVFMITALANRAVPVGGLVEAWVADMHNRLVTAQKGSFALKPIVVEVYAQPSGGFSRARLRQGSGSSGIDQDLLASIIFQQQLVPEGLVPEPTWLSLPEIEPDHDSSPVQ